MRWLGLVCIVMVACKGGSSGTVSGTRTADATARHWVGLAAGDQSTCAGDDAGHWWCWGDAQVGALGAAATQSCGELDLWRCINAPALLGLDAASLALAPRTTCGLGADHVVRCQGADDAGTLGRGDGATLASCPATVIGNVIRSLDDGAVLNDGGLPVKTVAVPCSPTPVPIAGGRAAHALVATDTQLCAALDDGVACWGAGARTPTPVAGLGAVTALAAGPDEVAALRADGTVVTWAAGQPLVPVPGLTGAIAIAVGGGSYACAVLGDGTVRCWHRDGAGPPTLASPLAIRGATAIAMQRGGDNVCVIVAGGAVECAGDNRYAQLGTGGRDSGDTPAAVPGVTGAVALVMGTLHTCALGAAGTLWCWGVDDHDQLAGAGDTECYDRRPMDGPNLDAVRCARHPVAIALPAR